MPIRLLYPHIYGVSFFHVIFCQRFMCMLFVEGTSASLVCAEIANQNESYKIENWNEDWKFSFLLVLWCGAFLRFCCPYYIPVRAITFLQQGAN